MATRTWRPTSGNNWTTDANWAEGSKPTNADVAVFDASSGDVVLDATGAVCQSLDFTGYSGTVTRVAANVVIVGGASAGAISLSPSATHTGLVITCSSSVSGNTIASNGATSFGWTFDGTGDWTLSDAFATTTLVSVTRGTLDTNDKSVTIQRLTCNSTNTRSLVLGSSVITVTGQGTGTWDCGQTGSHVSSGLTVECGTSVIALTSTSSTAKRFTGGGNTWHIVRLTMGGTGTFDFRGSNTYYAIQTTGTPAAITLRFYGGHTHTFTGDDPLPSGTPGNLVTISSDTTEATTHTLSKSSGVVSVDYMHISNSVATGGAQWYAGANSTDGGGNSGWIFSAPPAAAATKVVAGAYGLTLGIGLTIR